MIWGRAGGNWRLEEGWDLIWKNENRKSCSGLSTFIMSWVVQKASLWSYHKVLLPAGRQLKYHRTNANPVVFGHHAYALPHRAWALSLTHVVDHNVTTEGPSWWRDHTPLWPHRPPLCTLHLGRYPSHVNGFRVACHPRKKKAFEGFDSAWPFQSFFMTLFHNLPIPLCHSWFCFLLNGDCVLYH